MTQSRGPLIRVTLLAVLGLLVSIGLGLATTNITSQTVGLSAEGASVSDELIVSEPERALARDRRAERRARRGSAADSTRTTDADDGSTRSDDAAGTGGGSDDRGGSDESSGGEDSDD